MVVKNLDLPKLRVRKEKRIVSQMMRMTRRTCTLDRRFLLVRFLVSRVNVQSRNSIIMLEKVVQCRRREKLHRRESSRHLARSHIPFLEFSILFSSARNMYAPRTHTQHTASRQWSFIYDRHTCSRTLFSSLAFTLVVASLCMQSIPICD